MLITVSFLYPARTFHLSTCSSEYKKLEFLVCSCCLVKMLEYEFGWSNVFRCCTTLQGHTT